MQIAMLVKYKKNKIESNYHKVAKQIKSQYEIVCLKFTSKFYRKISAIESSYLHYRNLNNQFLEILQSINKIKRLIAFSSTISFQLKNYLYLENIDWTRGRFSGILLKIVVREGKIIEKVFLTPKANRISVKRSELGSILKIADTIY